MDEHTVGLGIDYLGGGDRGGGGEQVPKESEGKGGWGDRRQTDRTAGRNSENRDTANCLGEASREGQRP